MPAPQPPILGGGPAAALWVSKTVSIVLLIITMEEDK